MSLDQQLAQCLKEKRYLKNVSESTIEYLEYCYRAFKRVLNIDGSSDIIITKQLLNDFVIGMKEQGSSTGAANAYIRGFNSFLSWLYETGHTSEHLKIKQLKQEQRVMKTFSDADIKRIINWKPHTFEEHRLYALLCLLIDTGCRIEEALTLETSKVDLNNMLITVIGKGNKERVIPMSYELRRVLYRWSDKHESRLFFPNRHGGRLLYDNVRREFNRLMKKLGIEGFDGSFHAFRRKFARSYVKNGGNLFYLMKALGHTTLAMSKRYVELDEQDLSEMHAKTSILNRLR